MADALVKQLVEAGVHFGHRASRWNPKMGPYIYGRQKLIHIIDVRETVRGLLRARKYFIFLKNLFRKPPLFCKCGNFLHKKYLTSCISVRINWEP